MASFDKLTSLPLEAGESIQAKFLLIRREQVAEEGMETYLARQKENGRLVWLKLACTGSSAGALEAESQLLRGLNLPHLARLIAASCREEHPYLALQWLGELPLNPDRLALLSAPERCRLAQQLVATVSALADAPQQVALPTLLPCQLWVTPGLHYLRLLGLPETVAGGGHEAMVRGRQASWNCARVVLSLDPIAVDAELERAAAAWCERGRQAVPYLEQLLQHALFTSVASGA